MSAKRKFDLKSQVWFETKTERQEVQLPLYYSRFKIAEFSQYQCLVDLVANLLKSETKRLFSTSHFVFVTEMMWYRAKMVQYVAQYPDGTSIRTLETKTQFLRRPFQFSVNEVFRMKAEHFSFKMKVLAIWKLAKQSQKTPFCSGE